MTWLPAVKMQTSKMAPWPALAVFFGRDLLPKPLSDPSCAECPIFARISPHDLR